MTFKIKYGTLTLEFSPESTAYTVSDLKQEGLPQGELGYPDNVEYLRGTEVLDDSSIIRPGETITVEKKAASKGVSLLGMLLAAAIIR